MAGGQMGHAALHTQRGATAVLDPDGNVTWADEVWAARDGDTGFPRAPIGTNLLDAYRGKEDPRAQAVANAIVAILQDKATYFEIECASESGRSFLTSVARLRGDGAAAVVVHRVVSGGAPNDTSRPVDVYPRSARAIGDVDRLTPRERQVLDLMAVGLDNRAIAAKLGIEYTTVRGHVRAVIEKLGARSRLEAVARAYQGGWVAIE